MPSLCVFNAKILGIRVTQGMKRTGPASQLNLLQTSQLTQSVAGDKAAELNLLSTHQTGFAVADLDMQLAVGRRFWEGATITANT